MIRMECKKQFGACHRSLFLLGENDRSHVINEIYRCIKEISDKDLQNKLWIKGGFPDYISSYSELICSLLGDYNFRNFVDEDVYKLHFGEKLILELQKLYSKVITYNSTYGRAFSDKQILKDPNWDKIIEQAIRIIKLWDKDSVAVKYIK